MRFRSSVILAGLIAWALAGSVGRGTSADSPPDTRVVAQQAQRAVLVTGASSGIGLKITEHLAAKGYFVFASLRRRMEENSRTFEGSLFEEQLRGMFSGPDDRSQYKEPDEVAEAVLDFMSDENPKRRYLVVPNQREAEITIRQAIQELVQLNERHAYSYDRQSLIAMLDEALQASGR
ncbi:MAG: SDR family NAD(P)-dependent oxidoreductase [Gemmatimonadetes bacterium]|nr:SDR family NAD(P)-dependent oxidoreductase [Gemmatimonadota bacterium]